MRIFSSHLTLVVATALLSIGYPKTTTATTFNVTVGPGGDLVFMPSSITIHAGDQVKWIFGSSGHSTTSGSPGMPNGIWDSGIRNQGATFTRTFNSVGTFPYYCTPHGGCCNMVGTVAVVAESPTPRPTATATPRPTATATPRPTATPTATPRPTATPTPTPTPAIATAAVADFNGDGHPDWVVRNISTRVTVLVYLNDNTVVGAAVGPTITNNLALTGAADFNLDGHPDYALFAPTTFQTTLWYLSGPIRIGTAS